MSATILQLNLNFSVSSEDYEHVVSALVEDFAKVDGLRWKVWLMNKDESEAGGIYLFENKDSAKAFLSGPLAKQVSSHPALSNLSVKTFDVMDKLTSVTRGPV